MHIQKLLQGVSTGYAIENCNVVVVFWPRPCDKVKSDWSVNNHKPDENIALTLQNLFGHTVISLQIRIAAKVAWDKESRKVCT